MHIYFAIPASFYKSKIIPDCSFIDTFQFHAILNPSQLLCLLLHFTCAFNVCINKALSIPAQVFLLFCFLSLFYFFRQIIIAALILLESLSCLEKYSILKYRVVELRLSINYIFLNLCTQNSGHMTERTYLSLRNNDRGNDTAFYLIFCLHLINIPPSFCPEEHKHG